MKFDDIAQNSYDVDPDENLSISDGASVRVGREESAKNGGNHRTFDHLVSAKGGSHDPEVTTLLARAATWAYSDIESFQAMMKNYGIDCECVRLSFENEALLVSPYAYLAQSRDGRLAILCFRGTRPASLITWLMSTNVRMEPFGREGSVHGGFARATSALWPQLRTFLKGMLEGTSICRIFDDMTTPLKSCHPPAPVGRAAGPRRAARSGPEGASRRALEALYVTGHSLGGALAVLTAARIYTDSDVDVERLRDVLRGVYTFGQPMVGNRAFARRVGKKFESKLFRHIYHKDIVPRLPPRSLGCFEHFGLEYIEKNGRWMRGTETVKQVPWFVMYMALGVTALIIDQVPRLRWIRLPVSWGDHSPWWYLRTSKKIPPGSEFG